MRCRLWILFICATCVASPANATTIDWGAYLDAAYLYSSNQPANNEWRSKGTSAVLDQLRVNNVAVTTTTTASVTSRWGFMLGLQAGEDVDAQVSSAAVGSADTWKHLYYSNATYLFDVGAGLAVTGGLIPGHIGYESFRAGGNPTYTRAYGADNVPFFNWGVEATYAGGTKLSGSVRIMNAWDYLSRPNDVPTYGAQLNWDPTDDGRLTQNFYYGPDQSNTSLEYWRFVSNTIIAWRIQDVSLVGSLGLGTEKQAGVAGMPRHEWAWGVAWLDWQVNEVWTLALRPEVFLDEDGLISGSKQSIYAVTLGGGYHMSVIDTHSLAFRVEYRYDKSTGDGGGFFEGNDNRLVPEQHLVIAAVVWTFASLGVDRQQ